MNDKINDFFLEDNKNNLKLVESPDKEIIEKVKNWRLLRWDELPNFEIYNDQLLSIVLSQVSPFLSEKDISPSMINNYVKQNLLPKPVKKKYSKEHIALLTAISFVKQVFTMEEVGRGIKLYLDGKEFKEAYDSFCNIMENQIRRVFLGEEISYKEESVYLTEAIRSISGSLYVKGYLRRMYEEE
ncbi:MAG: DUF1836 domain-containing protein [Peptoniphilus sp.]|uniref:DUF1836 domain-containing protein n=1 Tax=Peptoniphilus sp. TaxID=1971214 RepID=UPI0025DE0D9F|nr:DUF1836 domain-containing protein [Peptoniphilus sp.]MCI5644036.1 DUF1836 domain-containing protein [Peptoniphilus sp.]MDD7352064.1 DUF1836 domain-containing protein [Peptoniphilaceae bacterium]MDY3902008.1 DUF1836 domain-containing protein [Peptoniphilus sp.]